MNALGSPFPWVAPPSMRATCSCFREPGPRSTAHPVDHNVLLVDSPDAIRRQTVPLGPGRRFCLICSGGDGHHAGHGHCPRPGCRPAGSHGHGGPQSGHAGAGTPFDGMADPDPRGGHDPAVRTITQTGTAGIIADAMVAAIGGSGPLLLLSGIFVVTAVLGQLISNTATALIIIPISLSVAAEASINPITVLMSVAVASSAALLDPRIHTGQHDDHAACRIPVRRLLEVWPGGHGAVRSRRDSVGASVLARPWKLIPRQILTVEHH